MYTWFKNGIDRIFVPENKTKKINNKNSLKF